MQSAKLQHSGGTNMSPLHRSDIETGIGRSFNLYNDQVQTFSWSDIRLSVPGKEEAKVLLNGISGTAHAGE